MRRTTIVLFMVGVLLALAGRPLGAQGECTRPLALVLSGGGAKGLAHIGVLRVLDSLGIRPDRVVGTSMGSIIGGMYASGYTGREIDSLARGLTLSDLFTQYAPRAPHALAPRTPLAVWEEGEGGFSFQSAAVREGEVNALLNAAMLRGNLQARGNFDSLRIPFRAVAARLADRTTVVLDSGDLARAVRASMAIPLIFDPERLHGEWLGDGGLVANIPTEQAREWGASRLLVVDVTEHLPDSADLANRLILAEQLLGYLFYQPAPKLKPGDLLIRPPVDSFRSLDFASDKVHQLIELGYEAARTQLAGYPCTGPEPSPPARPTFQIAEVNGAEPSHTEERFVRQLLGLIAGERLDIEQVRAGFRHLATNDAIRAVWLGPSGPPDSLRLDLNVRPASRRLAAFGLAYDNDLGGRMWLGAVDRKVLGQRAEGALAIGLGELRQDLEIGMRSYTVVQKPLRPALVLTLANEDIRRFDPDGNELPVLTIREATAFAGLEQRFGREWQVSFGGQARLWRLRGVGHEAVGGLLRVSSTDRDRPLRADAELAVLDQYTRAAATLAGRVALTGGFTLLPMIRFGWGSDLPPQQTFPLGGFDGFPGRHIGESRGNREAYAALTTTLRVIGPLALRVQGAVGQVATDGPAVPEGEWEVGGRAGAGIETPVGPIRVEYGIARGGRKEFFVRLGEWF